MRHFLDMLKSQGFTPLGGKTIPLHVTKYVQGCPCHQLGLLYPNPKHTHAHTRTCTHTHTHTHIPSCVNLKKAGPFLARRTFQILPPGGGSHQELAGITTKVGLLLRQPEKVRILEEITRTPSGNWGIDG